MLLSFRNSLSHPRRAVPLLALCLCLGLATGVAAKERALTDAAIADNVEDELLFEPAVPFNEIDVTVTEGVVTLKGTVHDMLARDRAVRIAEAVRGVRAVVDRIAVRPHAHRSAESIRGDVQRALFEDPATDSYELRVEVSEAGVVTLGGTVQSWHERELSETVAKGVRGVTGVNNEIRIRYATDRPDHEIKPEIEKQLRWDALVDHHLIQVEVDDGHVALSGTVGSAAEKRRARYGAWVANVKSVDDSKLQVAAWARDEHLRDTKYPAPADDEIRAAVKDAMLYDPRVASFEVTPTVVNGVVTLRGVVDNLTARRAAEEDARNVVGVRAVKNRLKVRPGDELPEGQVAENVRSVLKRDPYVERYEIDVDTDGGVVRLHGTVDSEFEKYRAEELAYRAKGVREVRNFLDVEAAVHYKLGHAIWNPWHLSGPFAYPRSYDDASIRAEIEDELWWSPFVDANQVTVTVNNGVATLTGTVDSLIEYRAAAENAFEGGAWIVRNDLIIR